MKPSSSATSSGPTVTKKSARAYGSTTAWKESSDSCMLSDGSPPPGDWPATPTKFPIAAMSGLKIFEDAAPPP